MSFFIGTQNFKRHLCNARHPERATRCRGQVDNTPAHKRTTIVDSNGRNLSILMVYHPHDRARKMEVAKKTSVMVLVVLLIVTGGF